MDAGRKDARQSIEVTVLGAGDAFNSKGRFQAGYLIRAGELAILLEAGPTVLAAMKRVGIGAGSLDAMLISHLHGDHFAGLPFLLLEYLYETPLEHKLVIAGPPHLEDRTLSLFHNMYPETSLDPIMDKLEFVVIEPAQTITLPGAVKVSSVRTPHMKKEPSLAFRIEVAEKVIAFSGDSGWMEELVELSAGSDLFLCECTYFDSVEFRFHINYPELFAQRDRLNTRRLVLTHLGREVLERASEVALEMAYDEMVIEV